MTSVSDYHQQNGIQFKPRAPPAWDLVFQFNIETTAKLQRHNQGRQLAPLPRATAATPNVYPVGKSTLGSV